MQDDQNQNEEEKRKNQSYQDLVMQQDPLLEEENDQATNPNDQSRNNDPEEQKADPEFTQELKKVVRKEKKQTEVVREQATELAESMQGFENNSPVIDQQIANKREENLEKHKIAAGKLKIIEGIGAMAADKVEQLKNEQLRRRGEEQLENAEDQEAKMQAGEVLNQIQQEAQKKAQEQIARQTLIKQVQDQRKKEAEAEKLKQAKLKKKKKKQGKGFLGLVKKDINPKNSPGKLLKPVGLNWITAYFESILP
jgi:hypothetical protein